MIANVTFTIDTGGKASDLASALSAQRGVVAVQINPIEHNLKVQYDSAGISCQRLEDQIRGLGCYIEKTQLDSYF